MNSTETLTILWPRVLGSGADPAQDFFEAGGDAVGAAELAALVHDAFGVTLTAPDIRDAPTVARLARLIDARRASADDRSAPGAPGNAPLAFSQVGMLWHEQFAPGSFNLAPLVRRYRGVLDEAALSAALADIVSRHAPLRTTYELVGGQAVQRVHPPEPLALPVTDLSHLDAADQRTSISAAIAGALDRPFDLAADRLFQPRLYRLGPDDHVLVIRLHHLCFDDWAVDVFRRDFSELYRAHHDGTAAQLAPLGTEFADFCLRHRERMAGAAGARQLEYWRSELAGAPLTLSLPLADPGLPAGSPHRAVVPVRHSLAAESIAGLRSVASKNRCSLFMALLGVFAVVAHGGSGQDDLLLSTVVANRNNAALEAVIGCFTKKVPLRLRVRAGASFAEVLAATRSSLFGALANQDLAFETIVQDTLGARAAALGVTPDISVVFQAETPRHGRLELPGIAVESFDAGAGLAQPHFAASEEGGRAGRNDDRGDGDRLPEAKATIWGGGLYAGTFLILSVVEEADGVSLEARGAFHLPAMERLLGHFDEVLARVAADPSVTVEELLGGGLSPEGWRQSGESRPSGVPDDDAPGLGTDVAGFRVDLAAVASHLAAHPDLAQVEVRRETGPDGGAEVLAYLVPRPGRPQPSLADLRAFLWSRLPGYVWPTAVVGVIPEASSVEEERLQSLWAQALGDRPVDARANYWQRFSFVDVLERAPEAGMTLSREQVRRNRTLRTLAADVASARLSGMAAGTCATAGGEGG